MDTEKQKITVKSVKSPSAAVAMEVEEASSGRVSRASSVSSVSEAGTLMKRTARKRRKTVLPEKSEGQEETENGPMAMIRKERASLEEFLFAESNKITRPGIKYILEKWSKLESKLQDVIIENEILKATHLEKDKASVSYAQVAGRPSVAAAGRSEPEKRRNIKKLNEVVLIKPATEEEKKK